MNNNYIYTFNDYAKEKWGRRIVKISLNTGILCPHKINNKGCTFCNESSFLPYPANKNKSLDYQFDYAVNRLSKRYKTNSFYAYFQAGTNTFGEIKTLIKNFEHFLEKDCIFGLIISTRPDYIDYSIVNELKKLMDKYQGKEFWIELGLQSVYDKTLKKINRGHNYDDFKNAVKIINDNSQFFISAHMIIGLPGETKEDIIKGIKTLTIENKIQGLKLHDLNILKDTKMEEEFLNKREDFLFLNEDSYISLVCDILENIPKNIVIMRILSDHPSFMLIKNEISSNPSKQNILKKINMLFEARKSFQGKKF